MVKTLKYIKLTQNKKAIIDDEDFKLISAYKWCATTNRRRIQDTYYAVRGFRIKGKNIQIRMHRLILNAPKDKEVDHINHNGLDNRKNNLRLCEKIQNQFNLRKRKNTSSKFKGVHFDKVNNSWNARLRYKKRDIWLGRFKKESDAGKAYLIKAIELFGEFAYQV